MKAKRPCHLRPRELPIQAVLANAHIEIGDSATPYEGTLQVLREEAIDRDVRVASAREEGGANGVGERGFWGERCIGGRLGAVLIGELHLEDNYGGGRVS